MKLVPNISASSYASSAFIIGLLLCDELTPAEQNSLGNWFMLVGQTLSTNASQQQLLNNRNNTSNNLNSHIINDDNLKQSANNIKNEINNIFNKYK
jgi:hypothetical protein